MRGSGEDLECNRPRMAPGKFSRSNTYSVKFLSSHNICLRKKLNIH